MRASRSWMLPWVLAGLLILAGPDFALSQVTAAEWLAEAGKLFQSRDLVGARGAVGRTIEIAEKEQKRHIDQGLELARRIGARHTEALLLHVWGDRDYGSDDFRSAFDRLDQARSILEELGDRDALARVLTSLGRLYRVHGHADQAIPFY